MNKKGKDSDSIDPTIRILYVQHVGVLGGSSRSLFELISNFPKRSVSPYLVAPPGELASMMSIVGVPVQLCLGISQFDNCSYSYYRGLRWLILLREAFLLGPTYFALRKAKKKWGHFDIIHINDVTLLFPVWLSRRLFPNSRVVVHARAVQRKAKTFRKAWLAALLRNCSDALFAINLNVSKSLPDNLAVHIVHNGLTLPGATNVSHQIRGRRFTVAMVGVLSRAKGCLDFIKAAGVCRDRGYDVSFLLVGGESQAIRRWDKKIIRKLGLRDDVTDDAAKLVAQLGLDEIVEFRPFCKDLNMVYRNMDVVCFPSYLDAPGRPIFEAGFYGVPSIASISKPQADTFLPDKTGVIVKPCDPTSLADAIIRLHDNPEERSRMGASAKQFSESHFDAEKNSKMVLSLYRKLLSLK
jgi:glycosyltransferase involved in cell wall biosynthesis